MESVASMGMGTWVDCLPKVSEKSFIEAHKGKIILLVALTAIACLASGGSLYFLGMKSIIALSLLGGGGVFVLIEAALVAYLIYKNRSSSSTAVPNLLANASVKEQKSSEIEGSEGLNLTQESKESNYNIYTWNIGTLHRDFRNTLKINQQMVNGATYFEAYNDVSSMPPKLIAEEIELRTTLFKREFATFDGADIICLQESYEYSTTQIKEMLPEGYEVYSFKQLTENDPQRKSGQTAIIWNSSKFTKTAEATLDYDEDTIPGFNRSPNTMVLLKDNSNELTFSVTSAHLRGFNLSGFNQESPLAGNNQATYELMTAQQKLADVTIYAGDFNVTHEHYKPRLKQLEDRGYVTDITDIEPTIYDAYLKEENKAPKAVKLDHIYAKPNETKKTKVTVKKKEFGKTPVTNFNRPSDHVPVGATLTVTIG